MARELHRGTVTFLFTDMEASTVLLKQLGGPRYHDVLVEHQRLLRTAFEEAGGREVDSQGDAFFVAFQKAGDAVAAAVAAQRALAAHEWPEGVQVRVRMGIDTGEPTIGGGRYVGLGVHRTARIMAAAHGGQVLLSRATRELVHGELPPETSLRDLGDQRLKDLDDPVRLFQVVTPGLPSTFPRLRTLQPVIRQRLLRPVVLAPAVVLVAAAIVGVLLLVRGPGGVITVEPNSLAAIDPHSNMTIGQVQLGIRPRSVAVGSRAVWVANEEDKTLSRIDPRTRKVVRTIPLGATPTGVATGTNAVWIAEGALGQLVRVDPTLNEVVKTIPVLGASVRVSGGPHGSVAVGGGSVWAAFGNSTVGRVDPATNHLTATALANFGASAAAYGQGVVWVADSTQNRLSRISAETNRNLGDINVGRSPGGVAVGGGAVWVADTDDDAVSRVDPGSGSVTTIPVGDGPAGIAYGAGGLWVANSGDGTVSRIDPSVGKLVKTIRVGGRPVGVAVGAGLVWVTVDER